MRAFFLAPRAAEIACGARLTMYAMRVNGHAMLVSTHSFDEFGFELLELLHVLAQIRLGHPFSYRHASLASFESEVLERLWLGLAPATVDETLRRDSARSRGVGAGLPCGNGGGGRRSGS
eukprot:5682659-Pleurochrysis_carterae.AAC.1